MVKRKISPMSSAYPHLNPYRGEYYRSDVVDTLVGVERFIREEFRSLLPAVRATKIESRIPVWGEGLSNEEVGRIIGHLDPASSDLKNLPIAISHYGQQVRRLRKAQRDPNIPDVELRAARVELAVSVMALMRTLNNVFLGAKDRADRAEERKRRPPT